MLKLTYAQLKKIINDKLDGKEKEYWLENFKTTFDGLPSDHEDSEGMSSEDFCEDDGRQMRWFIFENKVNGQEYCINYLYSHFGCDLIESEEEITSQTGIVFVDDESLSTLK